MFLHIMVGQNPKKSKFKETTLLKYICVENIYVTTS
jgi:hypothetical protein